MSKFQEKYEDFLMHKGVKGMKWGKHLASSIKEIDTSVNALNSGRKRKLVAKSDNFRQVPMKREKKVRSEESKARRKLVLDKNAANVADSIRKVPMKREKKVRSEESKARRKLVLDKNAANVADSIRKRDPNPQITAKGNAEIGNAAKNEVENNAILQLLLDDDTRRKLSKSVADQAKTDAKIEKSKEINAQNKSMADRIDKLLARKKKRESNSKQNFYNSLGKVIRGEK